MAARRAQTLTDGEEGGGSLERARMTGDRGPLDAKQIETRNVIHSNRRFHPRVSLEVSRHALVRSERRLRGHLVVHSRRARAALEPLRGPTPPRVSTRAYR